MNKKKQEVAVKFMAYYNREYAAIFYKYRLNMRRIQEIKELEIDIREASEMTNRQTSKKKTMTLTQSNLFYTINFNFFFALKGG